MANDESNQISLRAATFRSSPCLDIFTEWWPYGCFDGRFCSPWRALVAVLMSLIRTKQTSWTIWCRKWWRAKIFQVKIKLSPLVPFLSSKWTCVKTMQSFFKKGNSCSFISTVTPIMSGLNLNYRLVITRFSCDGYKNDFNFRTL